MWTTPHGNANDNEAHKVKIYRRNAKCHKFLEVLSYSVYVIRKSLENGEKKIQIFDMINNGPYGHDRENQDTWQNQKKKNGKIVNYIVLKELRKI